MTDLPKLVVKELRWTSPSPRPPSPPPSPRPPPVATVDGEPKPKNKSTVANPTRAVWAIVDETKAAHLNVTRKAIVECVRRGVALYTAKTQYQRWTKAKKITA